MVLLVGALIHQSLLLIFRYCDTFDKVYKVKLL